MAVSKTPGGRWRGIVKQGRTTTATKTFATKREALAWVERERAKSSGRLDVKAGRQSVSVIVAEYLQDRRPLVAETTWKTEKVLLTKWLPSWFQARSVASVSARDVERLLVETLADHAYSSMTRLRDCVRAFFAWAVRAGLCVENPVSLAVVPRRTEPVREMRPWTAKQLDAQVETWRELNESAARIAHFLGLTGLRWGEARALQVGDVSLVPYPSVFVQRSQSEGAAVKSTKSGKARRVPLAAPLLPFIQECMHEKGPNDALLPPMHRGRLTRQLRWDQTAGGRTIHDLRHSAICIWIAAGIDLATVRAWAGHADLKITSRYTHYLGSAADVASLERLNQGLNVGRGTPGVRPNDYQEGEASRRG